MLPAKRNKIDISSLTEEEQKLFRLYGKLPTHKNVLTKMQKDRKYFDSGDYALSKAGKAPQNTVGTAIPSPENIPHAASPVAIHTASVSPPNNIPVSSPIKESPLAEPTIFAAATDVAIASEETSTTAEEGVATDSVQEQHATEHSSSMADGADAADE
ncbi:camp-regulated phosphoprotein/endosulfine conserved region-domain-containing protein [Irpex rosettiformis]|uniref:Camp-regulated phosphoprotein/endosulfine conserved region-domain-containing protein n=1 Tax=Irpex rosettiformis TaxID=378272 RepID=A0ACB8TWY7_9APHY|nr:camp-regulated phosphoprotein/endosulfine conserved region-domain-containing protein [Irpex rosettiformis]